MLRNSEELDENQDRAVRLIKYLKELARLRSKLVREVKSYQKLLWFHDVPRYPEYCRTPACGATEELDQDIWLEISKYDEPTLDEVPDLCKKWVDYSTLYNSTLREKTDYPRLFASINIQIEEPNPDADPENQDDDQVITVTKTLYIKDFPDVSKTWDQFILDKWFPWAQLHIKWKAVHDVYSQLFTIHQEQQKEGEKYELVLGIGLLTWKNPTGHKIQRHLLILQRHFQIQHFNPSNLALC